MSSSCRWPGNWKRLSRASVNLRSGLPGWNVPPRRLTIPRCRRRKGKSPLVPRATSRREEPPRVRTDAAPEPGSCVRRRSDRVSEVSGGISGDIANPAADLRAHRTASHQARCDAGAPVRRSLRLLRLARDRSRSGRAGTRLAVRSVDRRLGGLFALRARHRHGTAGHAHERDLLAHPQRGCDQQHAGPRT